MNLKIEVKEMLFNSLAFGIFLPVCFIIYWALPHKFRWISLLASSVCFYASFEIKYIWTIAVATVISYLTGLALEKTSNKHIKNVTLTAAIVICLGLLFFYKYIYFAISLMVSFAQVFAVPISVEMKTIMQPIGMSFYTFQVIGYVIDVYRGKQKAETHFGRYALFVSFFPQLVAGPIERFGRMNPQFLEEKKFDRQNTEYALKLMALGFYKKLVIADNLKVYVDLAYGDLANYKGFTLLLASLFYTIQIYCDFSGYSDIAIGVARLFGINLVTNFKSPYFATSLKDFWGRWHISLSTWFRDYLYIPLGGNRKGTARKCLNLFLTFVVSGLWHGANATFLIWGALHGIGQVADHFLSNVTKKSASHFRILVQRVIVFCFVSFCWIFFRADSVRMAVAIIRGMFNGIKSPLTYLSNGFTAFQIPFLDGAGIAISILLLAIFDVFSLRRDPFCMLEKLPKYTRWVIYYTFLLLFFMMASFNSKEFLYSQF